MIACIVGMTVTIIICSLHYMINERPYEGDPLEPPEPFVVSEYYDRMEQADLDILECQEPVEQTIILWWGLDGLCLNEDGKLEWVSRRKQNHVPVNTVYQLCQSVQPYNTALFDQTQSTRAKIENLMEQNASLQIQAWQAEQRIQCMNSLHQCCVQTHGYYVPYHYTGCCCNFIG